MTTARVGVSFSKVCSCNALIYLLSLDFTRVEERWASAHRQYRVRSIPGYIGADVNGDAR
jgi:hypothetical protein